jgi:hypothetical protein
MSNDVNPPPLTTEPSGEITMPVAAAMRLRSPAVREPSTLVGGVCEPKDLDWLPAEAVVSVLLESGSRPALAEMGEIVTVGHLVVVKVRHSVAEDRRS